MTREQNRYLGNSNSNFFNFFNSFQELVELENSSFPNNNQLKPSKHVIDYIDKPSIASIGTQEASLFKSESNINNYLNQNDGVLRLPSALTNPYHNLNPIDISSGLGAYYNFFYNNQFGNHSAPNINSAELTASSSVPYNHPSTCKDNFYSRQRLSPKTSFYDRNGTFEDTPSLTFVNNKASSFCTATNSSVLNEIESTIPPCLTSFFPDSLPKIRHYDDSDIVPELVQSQKKKSSPNNFNKTSKVLSYTPYTSLEKPASSSGFISSLNLMHPHTKMPNGSMSFSNNTCFGSLNSLSATTTKIQKPRCSSTSKVLSSSLVFKASDYPKLNRSSITITKPKSALKINTLDYKLIKIFSNNKLRSLFENNFGNPCVLKSRSKSMDFLHLNTFDYFNSELVILKKSMIPDSLAPSTSFPVAIGSDLKHQPHSRTFAFSSNEILSPISFSISASKKFDLLSLLPSYKFGHQESLNKSRSLFFDDNLIYNIPKDTKTNIITNLLSCIDPKASITVSVNYKRLLDFNGNLVDSFFIPRPLKQIIFPGKKPGKFDLSLKSKSKSKPKNNKLKQIKFIFAQNTINVDKSLKSTFKRSYSLQEEINETTSSQDQKSQTSELDPDEKSLKRHRRASLKTGLEFVYIQKEAANEAAKYNCGLTKLYIHNKNLKSQNKKVIKSRITSIPSRINDPSELFLEK
ncbi:hypothetical protein BB560_004654 [Smittium megazygosporum]|uniref:Uncharacterized protein n=1 Tax=Smittium megazygosporum TaxID=133381 RepID=A0A2T9Z8T0_9FUNG|nr:hypothetical protein BB560_004654 [Smittium megazygosporum]